MRRGAWVDTDKTFIPIVPHIGGGNLSLSLRGLSKEPSSISALQENCRAAVRIVGVFAVGFAEVTSFDERAECWPFRLQVSEDEKDAYRYMRFPISRWRIFRRAGGAHFNLHVL
jgi:hypothetical protein